MKKAKPAVNKVMYLFFLIFTAALLLAGCGNSAEQEAAPPGQAAPPQTSPSEEHVALNIPPTEYEVTDEKNPIATMQMENGDIIVIELYPDIAPISVHNFIALANSGYYDGVIFHRVIPGFMIQGGDPEGTGRGGPGYCIFGEFSNNGFTNDLAHTRGVVSMARKGDQINPASMYDSAGSQFFICVATAPGLDFDYAGFGMVVYGMDAADDIVHTPRDAYDKPLSDQRIAKLTVDTKGVEYPAPEKLPLI